MKCTCCDRRLSDYEATRRHQVTGEFLDICSGCMSEIVQMAYIPYTDRPDLRTEVDYGEGEYETDIDSTAQSE